MARSLRQALRDYCNLNADLADLTAALNEAHGEDKQYLTGLKRRVHEYMQLHKVECFFDAQSTQFVYRSARNTARPLSDEMQQLILEEVAKAEQTANLSGTDVQTLLLAVIALIQEVRTKTTETLKIASKKPETIKVAVTPDIPEVTHMVHEYITLTQKINHANAAVTQVKKDLKEQLVSVEPVVKEYCAGHSIVKKPMNFPRRWSSAFSTCMAAMDPEYFKKKHARTARRYLQYKQSKARNRKVTTLRPSKKHMTEILQNVVASKKTGWTYTTLVQTLFRYLYQEAEEAIVHKLEESDKTPVFKVSLGATVGLEEDE